MLKRQHVRAHRTTTLIAAAASLAIGSSAQAQTTIAYNGGTYTQNFDTLPGSGTIAFEGTGPFDLSAAPVNAGGMMGWSLAKASGSGANATLIANAGNTTTGSAYSYGVVGEGDRALGSVASGAHVAAFGATFVNTGSVALNLFTINFTMEQWRNGGSGNVNALSFAYGLGATDILNGTFTPAQSLDAVSVINAAGGGSLNGNLPANQASVNATVSGLNWLPGQALVIKWTDNDESGADSGVAIDNFSFVATGGAKDLVWNPLGAGGTSWSTSPANTNWLDGATPSAFANGDIANFTSSGVGLVNIDAGGVAPGAFNVSNDSASYVFAGGAIGGSAALVKTGNGTLVLNNMNTFTGGTTISAGTVVISSNAALGAPTTGITLGGGALRITSSMNTTRAIALLADTTSTIDAAPGAASVTFASVTGAGSFRKSGGGTVAVNGAYNIGGTTSVLGGALVLGQNTGSVNLSATSDNNWVGDLVIANGIRVNFNGGSFGGGGNVRVQASAAVLSTTGALTGQTANIGNGVLLNSNNLAGPFVTTIGATAQNNVVIGGVVSGNSDVIFSSSTAGAGSGIIVLNNANTWTGTTTISTATGGVVRLGTSNALPTTTNLVFGTGTFNAGALDLAGFNQSLASLRSDTGGTINGIANTGGPTSMLTVTGSATTSFAGTIGVPSDLSNLPGANANIALALAPSHTGELTLAAANNHAAGTSVAGGTLVAAHAMALGTGSLSVPGGVARLAPALGAPVVLQHVSVSGSGRFDLTDNAVVIDYETDSPFNAIRASIVGAYNGGSWDNPGITSSNANASQLGVAYAEASALASVPPIFGSVDSTAVLLRLTRYGDANLDGLVNLQDFNRLAANFGGTGAVWSQGDFNYDGNVNLQDFNRLAGNFGLSAAGPEVTPEDWAALASAVPEPSAGVILVLGAGQLARRRRGTVASALG